MEIKTTITLNKKDLVFEHFEDEVVIINLNTGIYYSMSGLAQTLWQLSDPECNLADALELLAEYPFGCGKNEQKEIFDFYRQLADEGLVVVSAGSSKSENGKKSLRSRITEAALEKRYSKPEINKYSDQQELLLLDPIHEVDDLGWPSKNMDPDDD